MAIYYDKTRPYVGLDYPATRAAGMKDKRWRSEQDKARVSHYDEYENIFLGNHSKGDGGPFRHPYMEKATTRLIPYKQFNLLGKATSKMSDMIVGDGLIVTSPDEAANEYLSKINFDARLVDLMNRVAYLGFAGMQPMRSVDINGKEYYKWTIIDPGNLYLTWHPSHDEITSIRKAVVFKQIQVSDKKRIDVLYEEVHVKGVIYVMLYEIEGEQIKRDLPLEFYTEFIDSTAELEKEVSTGIENDFLISLVFGNRMRAEALSDYTTTAMKLQMAINDRLTQIDRVLFLHSTPRMTVPQEYAQQDKDTGEWKVLQQLDEMVLIPPGHDERVYQYLTWDGQLQEARNNLLFNIMALCTEMDVTPHMIAITDIVQTSTADTYSKLKLMSDSAVKRATAKRRHLDTALQSLIRNLLILQGFSNETEFSIEYPSIITESPEDVLNEMIARKQAGLVSTLTAIMKIDGLTEEEAMIEASRIAEEEASRVPNPFLEQQYLAQSEAMMEGDGEE